MSPAAERLLATLRLTGRSTRTSVLRLAVACALALVALFVLDMELQRGGVRSEEALGGLRLLAAAAPWIEAAVLLTLLWLAIRRFQDQDRPGWLGAVNSGAILFVLVTSLPPSERLALLLLCLAPLFLPATVGPNRYGPDPRGWRSREHYEEERRRGRAQ